MVGPLVSALLVLGALFLAHGLQCAAADTHGPAAMSHPMAAAGASDAPMHEGETGVEFLTSMRVSALAEPVDARDFLGHGGQVCVAVLIAGAVFWLLAKKTLPGCSGGLLWPARRVSAQLHAAARWRPPSPGLTLLCVSRT